MLNFSWNFLKPLLVRDLHFSVAQQLLMHFAWLQLRKARQRPRLLELK